MTDNENESVPYIVCILHHQEETRIASWLWPYLVEECQQCEYCTISISPSRWNMMDRRRSLEGHKREERVGLIILSASKPASKMFNQTNHEQWQRQEEDQVPKTKRAKKKVTSNEEETVTVTIPESMELSKAMNDIFGLPDDGRVRVRHFYSPWKASKCLRSL